jgi:hypothetical protein
MRVLREIPHPDYKITIFNWYNRYIIKVEQGPLEQTFKIQEYDVAGDDGLLKLIDEPFIRQALDRFFDMNTSVAEALKRS